MFKGPSMTKVCFSLFYNNNKKKGNLINLFLNYLYYTNYAALAYSKFVIMFSI